ncbi:hypothetical protein [Catenovulum maritimum]|uniref:Uncharacterized protein n=1 Tax=Catenovulum maritimum TaxID=1513271 RepID=A0A0J8GV14_9ALTE|nr:hypothetical protein [Catenovulum maritimum]KMT66572.1 hypothetical protein XM47_03305 [Catenovulum maritimum]
MDYHQHVANQFAYYGYGHQVQPNASNMPATPNFIPSMPDYLPKQLPVVAERIIYEIDKQLGPSAFIAAKPYQVTHSHQSLKGLSEDLSRLIKQKLGTREKHGHIVAHALVNKAASINRFVLDGQIEIENQRLIITTSVKPVANNKLAASYRVSLPFN